MKLTGNQNQPLRQFKQASTFYRRVWLSELYDLDTSTKQEHSRVCFSRRITNITALVELFSWKPLYRAYIISGILPAELSHLVPSLILWGDLQGGIFPVLLNPSPRECGRRCRAVFVAGLEHGGISIQFNHVFISSR